MRKNLIQNIVALLLFVFIVTGLTVIFSKHAALFSETKAEDFSYTDSHGQSGHLYQFTDQTVVLHFWATWCQPCRAELPELINKAVATPDKVYILISVDQKKPAMTAFLAPYTKKMGKNVIIINDPDMAITNSHFKVDRFPETIILNKDKTIIQHLYGMTDWKNIK